MVKTRTWIIILAAVIVLSLAAYVFLINRGPAGTVAGIYVDGELIRSIDLSLVSEAETFTVETENGFNTILFEPGRICITEADCPDGVCVESGWLSDSAAPIVCLPHRLVIRLEGNSSQDIDSVSK